MLAPGKKSQFKVVELLEQIGKHQMELEWLTSYYDKRVPLCDYTLKCDQYRCHLPAGSKQREPQDSPIWPEKAFRTAAAKCVNSGAAWVKGRSSKYQGGGGTSKAVFLKDLPVLWSSKRSHPFIRFGHLQRLYLAAQRIPVYGCGNRPFIWHLISGNGLG